MNDDTIDLGAVAQLDAEAIGEPGQRRFRLVAANHVLAASLWVEKEQLGSLAMAVEALLERVPQDTESIEPEARPESLPFPAVPAIEFQVGRLALAFAPDSGQITLQAHDTEADPEGPATLSLQCTFPQLRALIGRISDLYAAGRPRCPLCGMPASGVHFCPGSNGHRDLNG